MCIRDRYNPNFDQKYCLEKGPEFHDNYPPMEYRFQCDMCGVRFNQKRGIERHLKAHESVCEVKYRKYTRNPEGRMLPNFENKFQCDICKKYFKTKKVLASHMVVHSEDPDVLYRFKCDVCSKGFKWKMCLKNHLRVHELDPSVKWPYQCDMCGKRYSRKAYLRKHIIQFSVDAKTNHPFQHTQTDDLGQNTNSGQKIDSTLKKSFQSGTSQFNDFASVFKSFCLDK